MPPQGLTPFCSQSTQFRNRGMHAALQELYDEKGALAAHLIIISLAKRPQVLSAPRACITMLERQSFHATMRRHCRKSRHRRYEQSCVDGSILPRCVPIESAKSMQNGGGWTHSARCAVSTPEHAYVKIPNVGSTRLETPARTRYGDDEREVAEKESASSTTGWFPS